MPCRRLCTSLLPLMKKLRSAAPKALAGRRSASTRKGIQLTQELESIAGTKKNWPEEEQA